MMGFTTRYGYFLAGNVKRWHLGGIPLGSHDLSKFDLSAEITKDNHGKVSKKEPAKVRTGWNLTIRKREMKFDPFEQCKKATGCLLGIFRGWNTTQLCGDYTNPVYFKDQDPN